MMLSRKRLCLLIDVRPAQEDMCFRKAQINYLDRLRIWVGSASGVVDYHTSKSVRPPLVRCAEGILLGYNFYDYVAFIPRRIWKKISSSVKSSIRKTRHRWHCSFTSWVPGHGEVLISGGPDMVSALVANGILRSEHAK